MIQEISPFTQEINEVDIRHIFTDLCNGGCVFCLNEGLDIPESRGGMAPNRNDLTPNQIFELYEAFFKVLPGKIRNFAITGGEPTIHQDKLIPMMQKLEENGVNWFLNTNATLISPELAASYHQAGLKMIKVNLPTMNPELHPQIMNPGLFSKQIDGILACLELGMKVDINIPLMRGINDTREALKEYKIFFDKTKSSDQVRIKFFKLEKGNYGSEHDEIFLRDHEYDPDLFVQKIDAQELEGDDFGRMKYYMVKIDDIEMKIAVISDCSPELIKDHPTQNTSFNLSPDGKLFRMFNNKEFYQFRFDPDSPPLEDQVRAALAFFAKDNSTS